MTFRSKLIALTILPIILITIAALWLIDAQSEKLAQTQGQVVENMIRNSKRAELQNYIKLARASVDPFYQWDNVSRLQAQKQVAEMITRMTFGDDGYFFVSRSNGNILQNPLLTDLDGHGKFKPYGDEVALLSNAVANGGVDGEDMIHYTWEKPSSKNKAEKIGMTVYLDKWDWVIGSGLYTDDIAAQIGQIQAQLDANVRQTRWVLLTMAIGAVALTSILLAFVRFSEQKFADKRLKALTSEIVDAQENERKRVSTELHDGISQTLVSARYALDIAYENAKGKKAVSEPVSRSIDAISTAISEIRRISMALRPSILDDMGLAAAVKSLGRDFEDQTGIQVDVSTQNIGNALNGREKTTLYRVAQEALANIAKHANATHAKIKLSKNPGQVRMVISDNGKGLENQERRAKNSGMGLRNMRERIESHDGNLSVSSPKNLGLKLEFSLTTRGENNAPNIVKEAAE